MEFQFQGKVHRLFRASLSSDTAPETHAWIVPVGANPTSDAPLTGLSVILSDYRRPGDVPLGPVLQTNCFYNFLVRRERWLLNKRYYLLNAIEQAGNGEGAAREDARPPEV